MKHDFTLRAFDLHQYIQYNIIYLHFNPMTPILYFIFYILYFKPNRLRLTMHLYKRTHI